MFNIGGPVQMEESVVAIFDRFSLASNKALTKSLTLFIIAASGSSSVLVTRCKFIVRSCDELQIIDCQLLS